MLDECTDWSRIHGHARRGSRTKEGLSRSGGKPGEKEKKNVLDNISNWRVFCSCLPLVVFSMSEIVGFRMPTGGRGGPLSEPGYALSCTYYRGLGGCYACDRTLIVLRERERETRVGSEACYWSCCCCFGRGQIWWCDVRKQDDEDRSDGAEDRHHQHKVIFDLDNPNIQETSTATGPGCFIN